MRTVDPIRHEEKRLEILEAAQRCFARDGLTGASIASICAEAGIGAGHLYHYFDNKEAIVEALTELVMQTTAAHFEHQEDPREAIVANVDRLFRAKGTPLLFELLGESAHNPALAKIMQRHSRQMKRLLAGLVRQGQTGGAIDASLDAEATATVLLAIIDGAKATSLRDPTLPRSETSAHLRELVLRFLAPAR